MYAKYHARTIASTYISHEMLICIDLYIYINLLYQDLPAVDVGIAALRYVEEELLNEIREAAEAALESLQDLRLGKTKYIHMFKIK